MPTLQRRGLYDAIWKSPVRTVAAELGISDVALAKICRKMNIPRPPRGYWVRVARGSAPKQARLPPAASDTPTTWTIAPKRPAPTRQEISAEAPPVIVVPAELQAPHKLVAQLQKLLNKAKPGDLGLVRAPFNTRALDVAVAPPSLKRALLLMDTVIKALEARGHEVMVDAAPRGDEGTRTIAVVHGVRVQVSLRESATRLDHVLTQKEQADQRRYGYSYARRYDYEPSGCLSWHNEGRFFDGTRKNWSDGKRKRLEDVVGGIVVGIEAAARAITRQHEEDERWERERREAERRRLEDERARKHREALQADLEDMASRLATARSIRTFLDAAEDCFPDLRAESDAAAWFAWAAEYADQLDPLSDPARIPKRLVPERDL